MLCFICGSDDADNCGCMPPPGEPRRRPQHQAAAANRGPLADQAADDMETRLQISRPATPSIQDRLHASRSHSLELQTGQRHQWDSRGAMAGQQAGPSGRVLEVRRHADQRTSQDRQPAQRNPDPRRSNRSTGPQAHGSLQPCPRGGRIGSRAGRAGPEAGYNAPPPKKPSNSGPPGEPEAPVVSARGTSLGKETSRPATGNVSSTTAQETKNPSASGEFPRNARGSQPLTPAPRCPLDPEARRVELAAAGSAESPSKPTRRGGRHIWIRFESDFIVSPKLREHSNHTCETFADTTQALFPLPGPTLDAPIRMARKQPPYDNEKKWTWQRDSSICEGDSSELSPYQWYMTLASPVLCPESCTWWQEDIKMMWRCLHTYCKISINPICTTRISILLEPDYGASDLRRILQAIIHFEVPMAEEIPNHPFYSSREVEIYGNFARNRTFRGKDRSKAISHIERQSDMLEAWAEIHQSPPGHCHQFCWTFVPDDDGHAGARLEFCQPPGCIKSGDAVKWIETTVSFIQGALAIPVLAQLERIKPDIDGLRRFLTWGRDGAKSGHKAAPKF